MRFYRRNLPVFACVRECMHARICMKKGHQRHDRSVRVPLKLSVLLGLCSEYSQSSLRGGKGQTGMRVMVYSPTERFILVSGMAYTREHFITRCPDCKSTRTWSNRDLVTMCLRCMSTNSCTVKLWSSGRSTRRVLETIFRFFSILMFYFGGSERNKNDSVHER